MNEKKEFPFQELSYAISTGDIQGIHSWFKKVGFQSGTELSSTLCKHIVNSNYFFSFSSNSFNKSALEDENLRRQIPVLSYFNLKEQLSILSSVSLDREIKIEHFNVLNYSRQSKSDKQLILKDLGMHHLFISLFNKEEFIFMDKIESVLGLDIKNNRMDNISIHYDYPDNGAFYLNSKNYKSCPVDDIILNYSENKANYLREKKINLPDLIYVNELKGKILEEIRDSKYFDTKGHTKKVEEKIERYFINYRYKLLSESIVVKPEVYKKAKKI